MSQLGCVNGTCIERPILELQITGLSIETLKDAITKLQSIPNVVFVWRNGGTGMFLDNLSAMPIEIALDGSSSTVTNPLVKDPLSYRFQRSDGSVVLGTVFKKINDQWTMNKYVDTVDLRCNENNANTLTLMSTHICVLYQQLYKITVDLRLRSN